MRTLPAKVLLTCSVPLTLLGALVTITWFASLETWRDSYGDRYLITNGLGWHAVLLLATALTGWMLTLVTARHYRLAEAAALGQPPPLNRVPAAVAGSLAGLLGGVFTIAVHVYVVELTARPVVGAVTWAALTSSLIAGVAAGIATYRLCCRYTQQRARARAASERRLRRWPHWLAVLCGGYLMAALVTSAGYRSFNYYDGRAGLGVLLVALGAGYAAGCVTHRLLRRRAGQLGGTNDLPVALCGGYLTAAVVATVIDGQFRDYGSLLVGLGVLLIALGAGYAAGCVTHRLLRRRAGQLGGTNDLPVALCGGYLAVAVVAIVFDGQFRDYGSLLVGLGVLLITLGTGCAFGYAAERMPRGRVEQRTAASDLAPAEPVSGMTEGDPQRAAQ